MVVVSQNNFSSNFLTRLSYVQTKILCCLTFNSRISTALKPAAIFLSNKVRMFTSTVSYRSRPILPDRLKSASFETCSCNRLNLAHSPIYYTLVYVAKVATVDSYNDINPWAPAENFHHPHLKKSHRRRKWNVYSSRDVLDQIYRSVLRVPHSRSTILGIL